MLTRKQHELICFIHDRLEESGVSPSFEEMKEALDLKSKSGVHRLISALEERKFLRRLPNRARALEVLRIPEIAGSGKAAKAEPASSPAARSLPEAANDVLEIPLHGRIADADPGGVAPARSRTRRASSCRFVVSSRPSKEVIRSRDHSPNQG